MELVGMLEDMAIAEPEKEQMPASNEEA